MNYKVFKIKEENLTKYKTLKFNKIVSDTYSNQFNLEVKDARQNFKT